MKSSRFITLLSLTSTTLAAPRYPHVVRQLPTSPDPGLAVTLPVALPNSGNAVVDTINTWREHITAINNFMEIATKQLAAPLASQDYSVIVNGLQGLQEDARQEPLLLAKLVSLVDTTGLTEETTNAIKTLTRELVNVNTIGILSAIEDRAKFTPVAKTPEELEGLSPSDKAQQPSCTLKDQMIELKGTRCCSVLQFTNTIWRNIVFNEGLGTLVVPDVPMPDLCSDRSLCGLNQRRCGPLEFTEGYDFVSSSPQVT